MKLMSLFLAAVMSGAARVSSAQQATTFIMTMGADTLGIERVTRTPGHLDGDFVSPARGVRVRYAATIAADGTMPQIETWAYRSAGDTSGTHASMQLQGDSMIIELQARTLRLASKPGAIAYFNPSVGLLEQAIIRAQSLGAGPTVEVPLFASEGG